MEKAHVGRRRDAIWNPLGEVGVNAPRGKQTLGWGGGGGIDMRIIFINVHLLYWENGGGGKKPFKSGYYFKKREKMISRGGLQVLGKRY